MQPASTDEAIPGPIDGLATASAVTEAGSEPRDSRHVD
jgi:hypothetical protein